MRSSSMKSLTTAVALTATLILAAPVASAKPSRPAERVQRAFTSIVQRIARIATNGLPGDPIPVTDPSLTSTTTPKRQR
jgi:hypothetical protein